MTRVRVVKAGGAQLEVPERLDRLAEHIRQITELHPEEQVVLVHGGGSEIAGLHAQLDVGFDRRLGLRVTSERSMDLVTMVLSGLVNTRLVARLISEGLRAVGMSGVDLGFMRSSFLNQRQLGRVGGPPRVDAAPLRVWLEQGALVVLSPVCLGPDGAPLNVNADAAAQGVAVALDAACLEFVTDVDAVHADGGPVRELSAADVQSLVCKPVIRGGMIPKLQATLAALDGGVGRVRVGSLNSLAHGTATEVHA